jgi:hypothetical protein
MPDLTRLKFMGGWYEQQSPVSAAAQEAHRVCGGMFGGAEKAALEQSTFSEAEEQDILALQLAKGNSWVSIAEELGTNRTGRQVYCRFLVLRRRR